MLGDFDQPLRKIEGLAPLHPDRHRRAQARAAMAAGAGFVLDDPIGLGDLAQGLAFVALLPAARPARPFAKAHWRARLPKPSLDGGFELVELSSPSLRLSSAFSARKASNSR